MRKAENSHARLYGLSERGEKRVPFNLLCVLSLSTYCCCWLPSISRDHGFAPLVKISCGRAVPVLTVQTSRIVTASAAVPVVTVDCASYSLVTDSVAVPVVTVQATR